MKRIRQLVCVLAILLGAGWPGGARAADSLPVVEHKAEARGYRIREVRWDPVLQQRWAVLENVAHPERPLVAELTDSGAIVATAAAPAPAPAQASPVFKVKDLAVRSGDRVVLWSVEENVRMQMGAVAEGNAAVGDRIQLRVTGAGFNGDAGWRVSGIVRAAGNVEWER